MKQLLPFTFLLLIPAISTAQAERRVMVEAFTQASCVPCANQNPGFHALLQNNDDHTVLLKYHTFWPGYDPMHLQNPSEARARTDYYLVNAVPNVRLDGEGAGTSGGVTQEMIESQLYQPTPIAIELSHRLSDGLDSIYIECLIINQDTLPFNPGGTVLHTAIVEKHILFPFPPGTTQEFEFKSVMRKMLPDAAGMPLGSIGPGDTARVAMATKLPSYIYNYAEIGVVAFVQKVNNWQVYQAAESLPKAIEGDFIDLGIRPASIPPASVCTYALTPQAEIYNEGQITIDSMEVSYALNDGQAVSQFWTGELPPGESVWINFPETEIVPGNAKVQFFIHQANGGLFDFNKMNEITAIERHPTLRVDPVGKEIWERFEFAFDGLPNRAIAVKKARNHLVIARNTDFSDVAQQIGGYGSSSRSLFSDLYNWNEIGGEAHLIFEKIDLSESKNTYLRFDYAHAQRPSSGPGSNDRLMLSVSVDCGDTWTTVWDKAGSQLATRPPLESRFFPLAAEWASDTISLAAFDGVEEFILRLTVISDHGNSIFIDNIRVNPAAIVSAREPSRLAVEVRAYPNPASSHARIELALDAPMAADVAIFDLNGRRVETLAAGARFAAGTHYLDWAPEHRGIFLLRVATEFGIFTERIAVLR